MSPPPFGHRGLVGSGKDLGYCGIEPCRPAPSGSRRARLNSFPPHSFSPHWRLLPSAPRRCRLGQGGVASVGSPCSSLVAPRRGGPCNARCPESFSRPRSLRFRADGGRRGFPPHHLPRRFVVSRCVGALFSARVGPAFARSLRSQRASCARIFYYSSANAARRMPVAIIESVP